MGFILAFFLSFSASCTNPDITENYDQLYIYTSPDRKAEQKLYVRFTGEAEIEYKILLIREDCKNEWSGTAKSSGGDGEIDEDADGNAYMAVEYRMETEAYFLGIRISEDREKVQLSYVANSQKVFCPPVTNELMYSE